MLLSVLLHAALSTTATASEMARAMARPIPRDAPVIITSDLLMVVDRSSGPAEESDKDGGSDEKDERREKR